MKNRDKWRFVRIKACELSAEVLAGRPELALHPHAWALTVFFESYIERGCLGTRKEFGPKKPRKLRALVGGVK